MKLSRTALAAASALTLALSLTACGDDDASTTPGASAGSGGDANASGTIALLLPETKTTRYEQADKPYFEAKVKELCPACTVQYSNANQKEPDQLSQAQSAIAQGAKVIVLDPVNGKTANTIVAEAKGAGIPVISYDRLVQNADLDLYISFDNERVGQLQGQALVDKMKADNVPTDKEIVMINGSPTDNNATLFKKGAKSVIDGSGYKVTRDYDTIEWEPSNAQNYMEQTITALGAAKIGGVYAANDGTAGGAIAAMKAANVTPLPPVTGQDAEAAGLQRILAKEQYMTVYKAIKPEAEQAATAAVALLRKQSVEGADDKVNNGQEDVPSILLEPKAITRETVKDVVADQYVTVAQLCTAPYAAACTELGIS